MHSVNPPSRSHNININNNIISSLPTTTKLVRNPWHMPTTCSPYAVTMPIYTRVDFDNPAVTGAVNPSAHGHHHCEHLQTIRDAYANNKQGPIPNNNPNWLPTRKLDATYTMHMLNTGAGQQNAVNSGARGMFLL